MGRPRVAFTLATLQVMSKNASEILASKESEGADRFMWCRYLHERLTACMKRIKNAHLHVIPASEETRGHLTTGFAKFWKKEVADFLAGMPKQAGER